MQSRRLLLVTAVATLVLLAGCVAPLQTDGATGASVDGIPSTISVSGAGEVTAEADLAVLSVAVTATADSADAARGQVATDAERMRQALRDAGVPDDAVTTSAYRVGVEYDYSGETREVVGYRAVHAYHVEVAPDRAGEIIDVVVGNGASEVSHVTFTLTDETRTDLRQQAIERAMDAARQDADTVAAAADLSVVGVQSASTQGGFQPYFAERAVADDASGGATTLEPGPVTVSVTVNVTYEAE
jgi:hypothetical protein